MHIINFVVTNAEKATANQWYAYKAWCLKFTIVSKNPEEKEVNCFERVGGLFTSYKKRQHNKEEAKKEMIIVSQKARTTHHY